MVKLMLLAAFCTFRYLIRPFSCIGLNLKSDEIFELLRKRGFQKIKFRGSEVVNINNNHKGELNSCGVELVYNCMPRNPSHG